MKKIFVKLMTLILSIVILSCFAACGKDNDNSEINFEDNKLQYIETQIDSRYKVEPELDPYSSVKSFRDGEYCYYYFDLGKITGIPIQEVTGIVEFNGANYEYTFHISETDTSTIANAVELAKEKCVSWTDSWSKKLNVKVPIENIVEMGIEGGYKKTIQQGIAITSAESYENVKSWSKTIAQDFKITFDNSYDKGFYRFIIMVDIKVTAVVVRNLNDDSYYLQNYSVIEGKYLTLDYSKTSEFKNNENELTFDFDENKINALPIPSLPDGNTKDYCGGTGTVSDPYLISRAKHFSNIQLNPTANFKVILNIDFENETIQPIKEFSGTLNGDGYKISNFKIDSNESTVGLFAVSSGNIKNLKVSNGNIKTDITGNDAKVGTLVGELKSGGKINKCKIENCEIEAYARDKSNTENDSRFTIVGGVSGKNNGGEISECTVNELSIYGYVKKHDKAWSENWNEAAFVYGGGIVGEFVGGVVNNNTVYTLNMEGNAEYRGNSAILIKIDTRSRICLGGVIGRMDGSRLSQSNNLCNTSASLFKYNFNSYNDTGKINKIEEYYFADIVGYAV